MLSIRGVFLWNLKEIVWLVCIVLLSLKSILKLYFVVLLYQSSESDRQLLARFHLYEQSLSELQHVLQFWDRTQSLLLQPMVSEAQETVDINCPPPSAKKSKKEREKEKAEKEKMKVEAADMKSPDPSQTQVSNDGAEGSEKIVVPQPIPYIWLSIKEKEQLDGFEIISSMKLPSHEEV